MVALEVSKQLWKVCGFFVSFTVAFGIGIHEPWWVFFAFFLTKKFFLLIELFCEEEN